MDRISNAEAALATLEEVVPRASNSVIERDSAILRLVYTFAVVRKACQNLLAQSEGIEASPGRVIGTARRLGWLSDEDAAAAGRDRALAFQTYRVGVGDEIASRLTSHAGVLRRWLDALKERAASGT
jgi:hypothetical protein